MHTYVMIESGIIIGLETNDYIALNDPIHCHEPQMGNATDEGY